jgi:hypothetical protein
MNKKLSSFLIIAIFLSAQAFSLLHVSKYSLEKHDHSGKNCELCLSADHNKLTNNNPTKLITPNLLTFKITLPEKVLSSSGEARFFNPRAPPFFS